MSLEDLGIVLIDCGLLIESTRVVGTNFLWTPQEREAIFIKKNNEGMGFDITCLYRYDWHCVSFEEIIYAYTECLKL